MKVVRLEIPSGESGTDATVRIIRQLIESGKRSLKIRYFAEWIVKLYNVAARDQVGEIAAIHDWAKKNIRYVQDPYRVEYVQTPERLLVTRTGDCDDFTALVGSLVEAIGYPVDIKVVARPGQKQFHHVYPVARIGAESVGLDASMPVPLGYESPEISRSKTYRSESNMLDVFGNGGLGAEPLDLHINRANGVPRGGGAVVITGGNGIRKIDPLPADVLDVTTMIPHYVRGVPTLQSLGKTLVIFPGNPLRDYYVRKLYERGFFVAAPGSQLTVVDFAGGISEVSAMKTGNGGPVIYPRPPTGDVILPTEWLPRPRFIDGTVIHPGAPNGVVVPTEGAGQFGPTIYLKLGQSWAGFDAKMRMDTGNLRPATENLMLVFRPYGNSQAGGTVTAVAKPRNGDYVPVVEPSDRVTVPEYDIFGKRTSQPVVVTTPGVPAPGIDTKTMLMIGGGLLAVLLLLRK